MTCQSPVLGQWARCVDPVQLAWIIALLGLNSLIMADDVGSSFLHEGRQALLRGQDSEAEATFSQIWKNASSGTAEQESAAFYLGLIADRRGDGAAAREWYSQAAKLSTHAQAKDFAMTLASLDERQQDRGDPFTRASSITLASFAEQANADVPNHCEATDGSRPALRLLQQARAAHPKDSLENRIKVMSSLLLHAEFASSEDEDLYTLANDHFAEGMELYRQIEAELDATAQAKTMAQAQLEALERDPDAPAHAIQEARAKAAKHTSIEELLLNPNTAHVVMRWDAIHVRWNVIQKDREPASRKHERERIQRLQELVTSYRDCTGKVSSAMTHALLGDAPTAEQLLRDAEDDYARIQEVVTREPRDFYLLTPEPAEDQLVKPVDDPNARIAYVPTPPFADQFASQLKAVRSLVWLQDAATEDLDRNDAFNGAEELAQRVLDPQHGDPSNALAYYVLGRIQDLRGHAKAASGLGQKAAHAAANLDLANAIRYFRECERLLRRDGGDVTDREPGLEDRQRPPRSDLVVGVQTVPRGRDDMSFSDDSFVSFQAEPVFRFSSVARQPAAREPRIVAEISRRLDELTKDDSYLLAAQDLTNKGQVDAAFVELERGLTSRPTESSAALWREWAQAGVRSGHAERVRNVLEESRRSGLIPGGHDGNLVLARAVLACVMEDMARNPIERMDVAQRARIGRDLRALVEVLEKDARAGHGVTQAMMWTYWGLAVTLASAADPGDDTLSSRRMEAYQRAKDAHGELVQEARTVPNRLDVREAIVAARFALGQLSLQLTDDRGDAVEAFSTALDELASLPAQPVAAKILGMPLLATLRASAPSDRLRRYETERQVRQALQHFLDGAISLNFGAPEAASDQMDQGLKRLQSDGQTTGLDAEHIVAALDGVDVQLIVPDLLRACKVLALVQQCDGVPDGATRQQLAERAVQEGEQLAGSVRGVGAAADRIAAAPGHAAMNGIALALALEQRAVALGLWPCPTRQQDLARARSELRRNRDLLTADLQRRYPTIARLAQDADDRLSSTTYYRERINAARDECRLVDARHLLEQALARHQGSRDSSDFWDQLLAVTAERADLSAWETGADASTEFVEVTTVLEQMAKHRVGSDFQKAYWEGYVRERAGQWQLAERKRHKQPFLARGLGFGGCFFHP